MFNLLRISLLIHVVFMFIHGIALTLHVIYLCNLLTFKDLCITFIYDEVSVCLDGLFSDSCFYDIILPCLAYCFVCYRSFNMSFITFKSWMWHPITTREGNSKWCFLCLHYIRCVDLKEHAKPNLTIYTFVSEYCTSNPCSRPRFIMSLHSLGTWDIRSTAFCYILKKQTKSVWPLGTETKCFNRCLWIQTPWVTQISKCYCAKILWKYIWKNWRIILPLYPDNQSQPLCCTSRSP